MNHNYLDFEKPIIELEKKINSLKKINKKYNNNIKLEKKILKLKQKKLILKSKIFYNLNPWEITQLSRHPMRPYTFDYIKLVFTDFQELSGDRCYGDDKAIVGGLGRLNKRPVMIIGHQKGRETKEKIKRNFGMPKPEGYRKSLRLMKIAERFKLPIITFIDTPGAYPGLEAEKRGQSAAIAENLQEMSKLHVPIICNVIGEGGSGGALAIGIGDKINMLQYSIYSVISPEGCASILWKNSKKAEIAAKAMKITSEYLKSMNLIDNVIEEPLGGAHRDYEKTAYNLKKQILKDLKNIDSFCLKELIKNRYQRLMKYGYC